MRQFVYVLALLAFVTTPLLARADDTAKMTTAPVVAPSKTFSDADKAAIQQIIRDYMVKDHPEVLIEASKVLQEREETSAKTKSAEAIKTLQDKIYNDPGSPVGGNPKGDVTIVEFFDFQCGYCKLSEADVLRIMKEDKNVKFIYKDFPILGPLSVTASKAALAAAKQNAYIKMHDALMAKKEHLSEDMIYDIAKSAGLDVSKLKKDMADDSIAKQIELNTDLGRDVGVRGTPMFIINDSVYPGALQFEQLKKAVDEARAAPKKN
jgi:hypothetical protein